MFDYILKGGTVVDGTMKKPFVADVCIKDGKIAKITEKTEEAAKQIFDVGGLTVAPGFIDIHSHSDAIPFVPYLCDCKLQQGVTTEITGNCGKSTLPATENSIDDLNLYLSTDLASSRGAKCPPARLSISDYATEINETGHIGNTGMLIGHCALRIAVTGFDDRNPNEKETEELKALLEREMKRGCFGMSLGLIYPPSAFSAREELVELSKVVAKYGGIVAVHMRNEGPKIFEAVEEMLSIAEESGVHLEISHLKLMGKPQWNKAGELLELIENAQKRGVKVTCDQYPFLASSTSLTAVLPNWAFDGGHKKIMERLENPTEELKTGIKQKIDDRGGANTILIVSADNCPQYSAKYVSDVMKESNLSDVDAVIKILYESETRVSCNYFCINEKDMLTIMPKLYISVGSDGTARTYDKSKDSTVPHPRNFGTFPQFFQTVREHNLMPIENAVYKCTAHPAKVLNITDRGILKEGLAADITVFDYQTIKNNSTYIDSRVKPDGIKLVFVNGKLALEDKEVKEANAGKVLLHK